MALENNGIRISKYYAIEKCDKAKAVARRHHGDTIEYLGESGDVMEITHEILDKLGHINFFFGSSPCNNVSKANPKRTGVDGNL